MWLIENTGFLLNTDWFISYLQVFALRYKREHCHASVSKKWKIDILRKGLFFILYIHLKKLKDGEPMINWSLFKGFSGQPVNDDTNVFY